MPLSPRLQPIADELCVLPAAERVLRTYAGHRPPSAEIDARPEATVDPNAIARRGT